MVRRARRPQAPVPSFPSAPPREEEDDEIEQPDAADEAEADEIAEEEVVAKDNSDLKYRRPEKRPPEPTVVQRPPVAQKAGRTVTVACKVPSGLVLQLQRPMRRREPAMGSATPQEVTYMVKYGDRYTVKGPSYPVGTPPKGFPKPPMNEGGFALTPGIPTDFWKQWVEQNQNAPYVKSGAIFAYTDIDDAVACAADNEGYLTGLEPISTDEDKNGRLTDRRLPRPLNMSVAKVGGDHDRMKERGGGD